MHIHRNSVQLFETIHRFHQEDNQSSSLYSLYGSAQQVGSQSLKILQNKHLISITQYLMRLLIIGIPDLVGADEEFKGIVYILIV